jgi:Ni,Fe-hydrogenase I cytochrome b subunit
MISQYALGRHGWVMALFFGAFAAASACLSAALVVRVEALLGRIGLAFLLAAAVGLAMAACFPMDPVGTPRERVSFSGKMHGVAFLVGVPCQLLAVLLLSVTLHSQASHAPLPLLTLTAVTWISLALVIAIMLMVGPGKPSNPDGPERFLGWPNRLFMISYGVWLVVAAWPIAPWQT